MPSPLLCRNKCISFRSPLLQILFPVRLVRSVGGNDPDVVALNVRCAEDVIRTRSSLCQKQVTWQVLVLRICLNKLQASGCPQDIIPCDASRCETHVNVIRPIYLPFIQAPTDKLDRVLRYLAIWLQAFPPVDANASLLGPGSTLQREDGTHRRLGCTAHGAIPSRPSGPPSPSL